MYIRDTIAAISTPPGNGGIGIIRISGERASVIGKTLFRPVHGGGFQSHRFYFGSIVDFQSDEVVDEAMAVFMQSPRSYTREDVFELHCHGGSLVVEKILDLALRAGARLADPGEFTKRAFLNGRIDLLQAEAVMDIISAKTDTALKLAQNQRSGSLSSCIIQSRDLLLRALAMIEAYIDFPEDDVGSEDISLILSLVSEARGMISTLIAGFDEGRVIREGVSVLIIGKPNVGKSSLLNCLLNENRAIVTQIPGTTRDVIEETVDIGGLAIRLLDTAGICNTEDVIEREGVNRALNLISEADIILFTLDGSRPFDEEDQRILDALRDSAVIAVINKSDIPCFLEEPAALEKLEKIRVSALSGSGVDQLKEMIRHHFLNQCSLDNREFIAISKARHRDALLSADRSMGLFVEGLHSGLTLELLAIELRDALGFFGAVTGQVTNDDLLDLIFSSFCIGK